ncbi:MAG: DinB family protein [Chitinophagaceae bacterium]|nr:DinB family protein [Chitinophagaceae bacterium]
MKDVLLKQYELVRESRSVLFDYCDTVKPEHFVQEVPGFGSGGSMRSLLTHVANSYQHWTAVHCFKESPVRITAETVSTVTESRDLYNRIDQLVYRLIESYKRNYDEEISGLTQGRLFIASPFRVFLHVITHEYHHKGQILSISRHLGYIPVDTDVLR